MNLGLHKAALIQYSRCWSSRFTFPFSQSSFLGCEIFPVHKTLRAPALCVWWKPPIWASPGILLPGSAPVLSCGRFSFPGRPGKSSWGKHLWFSCLCGQQAPTVAVRGCDGCFSNRLLESSGLALPFWRLIVENLSRALNKFYFVGL